MRDDQVSGAGGDREVPCCPARGAREFLCGGCTVQRNLERSLDEVGREKHGDVRHRARRKGEGSNHNSRIGATAPRPEEQTEGKDRSGSRPTSRPGVARAHPHLVATPR